jgi:DNA primase
VLIRKAQWLGNGQSPAGKPPALTSVPDAMSVTIGGTVLEDSSSILAAEPEMPPILEPTLAAVLPSAPAADPVAEQSDQEIVMVLGSGDDARRYRIRGWKKPLNPESLKVNLLVSRNHGGGADGSGDETGASDASPSAEIKTGFHVDTLDLYGAKARAAFAKQAGIELGSAEDAIKHDLGRVLLKLEALQDAELAGVLTRDERPALSEAERADALALLKAPDLMERILADFASIGVVGEETNALTGYLACVSRLLDRPLALIIQSSSAAGKSALMDAVLALMPDAAQVRYSAMTGQSLFYMGETNLKHRILAIAEEEGASSAAYALKLLQSDGAVTIASTGKDAATGQLVTQEYRVEGPVMLFLTTTAIDIDEELMNRCMVLSVDESREQTRAIHVAQRRRQTLAGLLAREDAQGTLALHRNAQGCLEAVKVINPFADELTFLDDKTRTRRDHMKYLTLIQAIALLHQYQRKVHEVHHRGKPVRYIEVEAGDIVLANRLAGEVLGCTLDELPPQTRRLLAMVNGWVREACAAQGIRQGELRFTRRTLRTVTGWGDTQLKVHLSRLADLEYLLVHRGAPGLSGGVGTFHYELLYDGDGISGTPFMMGLSGVMEGAAQGAAQGSALTCDPVRSGSGPVRSPTGRALVGPRSGGGRGGETAAEGRKSAGPVAPVPEPAKTHVTPLNGVAASYPHHANGGGSLLPLAASAAGA